jgi:hypothetical protein
MIKNEGLMGKYCIFVEGFVAVASTFLLKLLINTLSKGDKI